MVAGGSHDNSLFLDSTEIFNLEWPNNAKWVNAKNLPAPRSDFSAATLDNVVFAFGKYREIYPQAMLSLVQLLHYYAVIGREIHCYVRHLKPSFGQNAPLPFALLHKIRWLPCTERISCREQSLEIFLIMGFNHTTQKNN